MTEPDLNRFIRLRLAELRGRELRAIWREAALLETVSMSLPESDSLLADIRAVGRDYDENFSFEEFWEWSKRHERLVDAARRRVC